MPPETLDVQAECCARLGAYQHGLGNFERASYWYRLAREHGGEHRGVLFNLAVTCVRAGPERYEDALVALNALDARLEPTEPLKYASEYNRILAEHRILTPEGPEEPAEAKEAARVLCLKLLRISAPSDDLAHASLEGATISLLACLMLDEGDAHRAPMSREGLRAALEVKKHSGEGLAQFALEHHNKDPTTRFNLARRSAALGNRAVDDLRIAASQPLVQHLVDQDERLKEALGTEAEPKVPDPPPAEPSPRDEAASAALGAVATAVEDLLHSLAWLVTGSLPRGRDPGPPGRHVLQGVFSVQGLDLVRTGDGGRLSWDDVMARRLPLLLGDRVWPGVASHALERLERRHRERVAEWAPFLRGSRDLRAVLRRAEQMPERLAGLRADVLGRPDDPAATLEDWATTVAEAIRLREDLLRASGAERDDVTRFQTALPERYRGRRWWRPRA